MAFRSIESTSGRRNFLVIDPQSWFLNCPRRLAAKLPLSGDFCKRIDGHWQSDQSYCAGNQHLSFWRFSLHETAMTESHPWYVSGTSFCSEIISSAVAKLQKELEKKRHRYLSAEDRRSRFVPIPGNPFPCPRGFPFHGQVHCFTYANPAKRPILMLGDLGKELQNVQTILPLDANFLLLFCWSFSRCFAID
jgi:hypothetical protein